MLGLREVGVAAKADRRNPPAAQGNRLIELGGRPFVSRTVSQRLTTNSGSPVLAKVTTSAWYPHWPL